MDPIIEEIRQRADIVDVVNQYVALRPAGNGRFKACCPFHDEKTPSFTVSSDKGFFKCFGCNEGGDVFSFVQKIENITFPEAIERLAERYGVALKKSPEQAAANTERQLHHQILSAANNFFQAQLTGNAGWPARDYARERQLNKSTFEKFGIGYAPDAWDELRNHLQKKHGFAFNDIAKAGLLIERERSGKTNYYDRFRHRLIFPIHDTSGRIIAFGGRILSDAHTDAGQAKYINSPEGPLFKKSAVLYAYHLARASVSKQQSLIITEGYMDTIALHEAGFSNTVATLGTALTTQHVALLRRMSPNVVYLCFDGDSAGMKAALRSGPLFAAHNLDVRVVSLPAQDDPDTFIKHQGAPAFQEALDRAKLLAQYRVEQAVVPFDWKILAERKNAVRAGALIIAEVSSATERDAYIIWLAARWAQAENVTEPDRMRMLEDAVNSEVRQIMRRQYTNNHPASTREDDNEPADQVEETLQESVALHAGKGVIGAQKALLSVMLNNPSWRKYILDKVREDHWTEPDYHTLAKVLSMPDVQQLNISQLQDHLPQELHSLTTELVMSAPSEIPTDIVVDDWIARVQFHWLRLDEKAIFKLFQTKMENEEAITEDEKTAYQNILRATKRVKDPEDPNS